MPKEQHPNDIAYSKGYKQGVFDTEMRYQTTITTKDQEVKEMASKRNAIVKEYKEENVMFILKVEDGKTYGASMPIPKWGEIGKLELREALPTEDNK